MNKRKILGYIVWLVAFLVPLQYSIVSTDGVSNTVGVVSFTVLVVLVFLGYYLVDSADDGGGKAHAHGN
ncbi:MAG TPA: hypothetical protein PLV70_06935 [Flavobacteriales bacterium]|jgi:hypothetical protein|nr:hypothetical protein [Flavobacteriales bacterium]HRN37308.1 hypothetical protein [Flavobacteriales bacterium]HRO38529.1 hypothetical protein [Flavobacteriales bacterium]HRQ84833.1 hypothetical protein [Flavobacteriales bacterium]